MVQSLGEGGFESGASDGFVEELLLVGGRALLFLGEQGLEFVEAFLGLCLLVSEGLVHPVDVADQACNVGRWSCGSG